MTGRTGGSEEERAVKVGDVVWTRAEVAEAPHDLRHMRDVVWTQESTGKSVWSAPIDVLPDSPALPAVARFLAEQGDAIPAMVEALNEADWRGSLTAPVYGINALFALVAELEPAR